MSFENDNNHAQDGGDGADGAGDLSGVLASGEGDFTTGAEGATGAGNRTPALMFAAVVMIAVGGYFTFLKKGPDAASAAAVSPADAAAKKTISQFLDGGTQNIVTMQKMLHQTEKVVQQFLSYPSVEQIPLAALQSNPFRQRAVGPDNSAAESDAAAKRRREAERQAVLKAVQQLQLQSIIAGTRRACMINGTLYTEGQQVEEFVIEKINTGDVIVKSGVYRFQLKMQK